MHRRLEDMALRYLLGRARKTLSGWSITQTKTGAEITFYRAGVAALRPFVAETVKRSRRDALAAGFGVS